MIGSEGFAGEKPGVLYASYDGMLEPLGQSQVIPYLIRLAPDYRIHLLSFEKPRDLADKDAFEQLKARLAEGGITWHPMRYHKKPPLLSTVLDIAVGRLASLKIARSERISIFHGRSIICGVMLHRAARRVGGKIIADIRGFWVDERVDGGIISRNGLTHRVLKPIEKAVLQSADHIVTLTARSVPRLESDPRFGHPRGAIHVIPTCADLDRFRIQGPLQTRPFVLGYIGSVGTWYLLDEMLRCYVQLRSIVPDARLLVVNRNEHSMIRARASALGIPDGSLELAASSHEEMPNQIARMSAGMALIKPCFSKIASAPTKLAEYLGCGVPCLGTDVGDMGDILESADVGVTLRGNSDGDIANAMVRLVALTKNEGVQEKCRAAAERLFAIETGVAAYAAIYRSISSSREGGVSGMARRSPILFDLASGEKLLRTQQAHCKQSSSFLD